jgi:hypothetical protein
VSEERFLVTGALGYIGAWTCAVLAEEASTSRVSIWADKRRLLLATDIDVPVVQASIVDRERSTASSTNAGSRTSSISLPC